MRAHRLFACSLLALGIVAASPAAEACSVLPPVFDIWPAEGVTWPEGTPLYVHATAIALEDPEGAPYYEVTVDGAPASLVLVETVSFKRPFA